jgi:hypothetical protein
MTPTALQSKARRMYCRVHVELLDYTVNTLLRCTVTALYARAKKYSLHCAACALQGGITLLCCTALYCNALLCCVVWP